MTLPLILLLLLIASCLLMYKRRLSARIIYTLAAILILGIGCGWLPHILLSTIQAPYAAAPPLEWKARSAIVLLGMGTEKIAGSSEIKVNSFAYGRVAKTVMLYRSCKASGMECKVIISGGDARGYGASEAAVYGDDLQKLGVSPADLIMEDRSMNTWQNAQFTSALLASAKPPYDRVWLVSSAVHLTRSVMYFSHFGIETTPIAADYLSAPKLWIPVTYNFTLMDIGLHESLGVLRTKVYNAMGWNVTAVRAGAL